MNYEQARDEITKLFTEAWKATGYERRYSDLPGDPPSDVGTEDEPIQPWARYSMDFVTSEQESLGPVGGRIFKRRGKVEVQVFTAIGGGNRESDRLAQVVLDAYEGKDTPGGAWFDNVVKDAGTASGAWRQVNVVAEFEFYEVK